MVLTFSHGFDRKCLKDHFHFLRTHKRIFALLPVIPTYLASTEKLLDKGFQKVFSAAGSHFLMAAITSESDSVEDMVAQFLYTAIFMERLRYTQDKTISNRIPMPGNFESNWVPLVSPCPKSAVFVVDSFSQGKTLTKAANTTSSQLSRDNTVGSSGIETNYGAVWKIIRVIEILIGFSR